MKKLGDHLFKKKTASGSLNKQETDRINAAARKFFLKRKAAKK